jgi:hypothetical protein
MDSDYRRELATSGVGLHQEARARDGGMGVVRRRGSHASSAAVNRNNAREEERRKVCKGSRC